MKKELAMLMCAVMLGVTACGGSSSSGSATAAPEQAAAEEQAEEETVEEEPAEEPEAEPAEEPAAADPNELADGNPLKGIADAETMRDVYDAVDYAMVVSYTNGDLSTETDPDKITELEDEIIDGVAEEYGLSYEDVRNIYMYGGIGGNLYNYDLSALKLTHGQLVNATINGNILVIKAKIEPSYSNKATIDQNYFNVTDLVQDQGADVFREIQYWAVADMTNGSEGKVIQFTCKRDLIKHIKEDGLLGGMIADYVEDLWILPSLQQ